MAKKSNAKALLAAYDKIVAGIEQEQTEIAIYDPAAPLTIGEFSEVLNCYLNDYPQHFWVGTVFDYTYEQGSGFVYQFMPEYIIPPAELEAAKAKWDAAVKDILKDISGSASDYDREKMIHDRLAEKVAYVKTDHAYSAYGALVEGKAVCEGYAKAFQYLCYQAGLPCLMVAGSSLNPSTGQPESHAWNIVEIDGAYYHVDLTWDDQSPNIFYAYFNLTDQQIKESHAIATDNSALSTLPACNATAANYFVKNGGLLGSNYTVQQVGTLLKQGNGVARIFVDDTNAFWEWFNDNTSEISDFSGLSGHCSFIPLGHEGIIRLD